MSVSHSADATVTVIRDGDGESVRLTGGAVHVETPGQPAACVPISLAPVVIRDPAISRAHCSVTLTPDGLVLKDLGSKNGTFISGARVREIILPLGHRATLGASELWVQASGSPTDVPLSSAVSFGKVRGAS